MQWRGKVATATGFVQHLSPAEQEPADAVQEMFRIVSGFWLSRAVQVAATLGIPDLVSAQPRSVKELAAETSTDPQSLYRLLRALASSGIFHEVDGQRFTRTALSDVLRSGVPGSLRSAAVTELGNVHYESWGHLIDSVKTGGPAFHQVFGMGPWEYMARNPEMAALFNDSMTNLTRAVQRAISKAYDFSPYRRIVDVGGGQGLLLAGILAANPGARGILFDRAQVMEEARSVLAGCAEAERIELVGGDFFESVPAGGDLYTLKWIIHDWADREALRILENVRRAMAPNARVLLLEAVLPEANTPSLAPFMDLNMMVMAGCQERRVSEYRDLLAKAGLHLTNVFATESLVSLIEAIRS
jgi:hypothetical protein